MVAGGVGGVQLAKVSILAEPKTVPASAHPLISLVLPLLSDAEETSSDSDHDEGDDDHRDVVTRAGVRQLWCRVGQGLPDDADRWDQAVLGNLRRGCRGRSRCGWGCRGGRSRGRGGLAPKCRYLNEPRVQLLGTIVPCQLEADHGGIDLAVASLDTDDTGCRTWLQANDLAHCEIAESDGQIHRFLVVVGEARLERHHTVHADRRSALRSLPRTCKRGESQHRDHAEHGQHNKFLHFSPLGEDQPKLVRESFSRLGMNPALLPI